MSRRSKSAAGFSLIELLVTLSVVGILTGISVPSLTKRAADWRVRSTAEQLAAALRQARESAVMNNRTSMFALTDATPAYSVAAASKGSNWLISLMPSTLGGGAASSPSVIGHGTIVQPNHETLSGPALLCFDAVGQRTGGTAETTGLSSDCQPPLAAPTVYGISRPDGTRAFEVFVFLSGRIRMCEAAKAPPNVPDGCSQS